MPKARAGASQALSPGGQEVGEAGGSRSAPRRPSFWPVRSGARGQGGAAVSTAPRGRPGRNGPPPSALPGPGHDPRGSLLQACCRDHPSPAATSARRGPARPVCGSAVSPPKSGKCPAMRAPGSGPRCPPYPPPPSRRRRSSRVPQPRWAAYTPRKLGGGGGEPREGWGGPSWVRESP